MEHPHQPHDKLFKVGFSDPVNAAAFLKHQIPKAQDRGTVISSDS